MPYKEIKPLSPIPRYKLNLPMKTNYTYTRDERVEGQNRVSLAFGGRGDLSLNDYFSLLSVGYICLKSE